MKKNILFLITLFTFNICSKKTETFEGISDEIVSPKTYVIYKTNKPINIDGKDDEAIWKKTTYTDDFIDIEGVKIPKQKTNVKMLWDDNFLYVFAKLYENHIWADIKKRDAVIFYNNDFEVFINPSNDNHNYGEIEINALNTVWDLLLNKPYNVGGKPKNSWNLNDLKTEVHINGTLNNSNYEDEYWSVEMAIPLQPLVELKNRPKLKPKDGEQWRINFSRVQWDFDLNNGVYSRKKENGKFLREYNWVWSNQGAINMHLPENWGYVQFSDNQPDNKVEFKHQTDVLTEQITYALYRKINFKDYKYLKSKPVGTKINFKKVTVENKNLEVTFLKTFSGFNLITTNRETNMSYIISENGLLTRSKIKSKK